ncbi:hypothetical protein ACFWU5_05640 [Nocardia sp. NPDC058640]|uniref:hypothetical protein n=1 Tax=Nocardia sp. NPDC058640 TaxID=3346571 RepID=UPI00364964E0
MESGNVADHRFSRFTLTDELPPICIQHGRSADKWSDTAITFDGTQQYTTSYGLKESYVGDEGLLTKGLNKSVSRIPDADSVLHARLPMCRWCRLRTSLYSFAFLAGVFAAICTVIGALAAQQAGRMDLAKYFAIAIFPGWIPTGMIVLVTLFNRVQPTLNARRTADRRGLAVRAHPHFIEQFALLKEGSSPTNP